MMHFEPARVSAYAAVALAIIALASLVLSRFPNDSPDYIVLPATDDGVASVQIPDSAGGQVEGIEADTAFPENDYEERDPGLGSAVPETPPESRSQVASPFVPFTKTRRLSSGEEIPTPTGFPKIYVSSINWGATVVASFDGVSFTAKEHSKHIFERRGVSCAVYFGDVDLSASSVRTTTECNQAKDAN